MLLPELKIPVSIEVFETNFEYFINECVSSRKIPDLTNKKSEIAYSGHRYTIYCEQKDLIDSRPLKIGEIDVIKIHEEKVEIKTAIYNMEQSKEGSRFFDEFFEMIYQKWHIATSSLGGNPGNSLVATDIHLKIGFETGYFRLPGIISKIPESKDKYWNEEIEQYAVGQTKDFNLDISDTEREKIIQKYQIEINKGLPEIYEAVDVSIKHGVQDATMIRANRIKEIKDAHLDWSQALVVRKYNDKYNGEDNISTTALQNAYRAMDWEWIRADRIR